MRFFLASLSLLLVLVASSCDSSDNIIDPPDEWTLAACFTDDDPVAVFVGRAEIGCLSGAGFHEAVLDTVGHLFGGLDFYARGPDAVLIMQNVFLHTKAYRLDFLTGDVDLLSDPRTKGSQISELDPGRYLITDYYYDGTVSDTAYFSFQVADDSGVEPAGGVAIPDIGLLGFRDSDYDQSMNESAHLFVSSTLGEIRLLRIMHSDFRYEYVDLSTIESPGIVAYTGNGDLLVLDKVANSIYSVLDAPIVIVNVGPPLAGRTYRTIEKGPEGRLYVYSNSGATSEIYTLMPDFTLSHELSIPATIRAMHVNAETSLLCTRTYDYPRSGVGDYTENITFYDISTGVMTEISTMLAADKFELPQFGCL